MPRHAPGYIGPKRTVEQALESAVAVAERSDRVFPTAEAARIIGRDRGTLRAWIDRGAPVHSKKGGVVYLDLRDVLLWREEEVRALEAAKYARPAADAGSETAEPGADPFAGMPMTPKDALTLEQIKLTKIKIGREADILVLRSQPEARFERAMGLIRQALMAVPERLYRDMVGFDDDLLDEWRRKASAYCRAALVEGQKALVEDLGEAAPPADEEAETTR